jgi:hypothetical protein
MPRFSFGCEVCEVTLGFVRFSLREICYFSIEAGSLIRRRTRRARRLPKTASSICWSFSSGVGWSSCSR